jgi:hypothetical protein
MRPIVGLPPRQFLRLWPRLIDPAIDYRVVFYLLPPRDWGARAPARRPLQPASA